MLVAKKASKGASRPETEPAQTGTKTGAAPKGASQQRAARAVGSCDGCHLPGDEPQTVYLTEDKQGPCWLCILCKDD